MDSLKKVYQTLKDYNTTISKELVQIIKMNKILFFIGSPLTAKHLGKTYGTRLHINQDQSNWPETWDNWSSVVKDLNELGESNICGVSIHSDYKYHLVFMDLELTKIYGILWFPNKSSTLDALKSNDEMISKGHQVSSVLFDKMNLVKDWK